jgi:UDP-glucose 4-epimerase
LKAVVTGGAGFIASHLIDRLLEDGYSVTAFDNLTEGHLENIAHLKHEKKFEFKRADLKNARAVNALVAGKDAVFHLAAQANIRASLVDHTSDLENNLIGTVNVLEAMAKHKVKDLVFSSTSAVYGEATIRPTREDYMPTQTSLYGASKLAGEAYSEAFGQFSDINFWAYRFSNIIGERCRRGVIWDFVKKLRRNPRELEILGDGKQSKEYLHVSDCVSGIMTGYEKAKGKVNIFNLAIEDNRTPDEVADIVIQEMGLSNVKRRYTGGPRGWIGDNPIVHLSIGKIKSLGWSPKISSLDAITRTARWTVAETAPSKKKR